MSALARILKQKGKQVQGSDLASTYVTEALEKEGIEVFFSHSAEHVKEQAHIIEGNAKLRFGSKSALFGQDPDSAQVAYSNPSMSTCAETGPAQKSSNLASKASFAIPSYIDLIF